MLPTVGDQPLWGRLTTSSLGRVEEEVAQRLSLCRGPQRSFDPQIVRKRRRGLSGSTG